MEYNRILGGLTSGKLLNHRPSFQMSLLFWHKRPHILVRSPINKMGSFFFIQNMYCKNIDILFFYWQVIDLLRLLWCTVLSTNWISSNFIFLWRMVWWFSRIGWIICNHVTDSMKPKDFCNSQRSDEIQGFSVFFSNMFNCPHVEQHSAWHNLIKIRCLLDLFLIFVFHSWYTVKPALNVTSI